MDSSNDMVLDNPVWHSLDEVQKEFCLDHSNLKCYHPDYCPFGAWNNDQHISNALAQYSTLANNFYIVGNKPDLAGQLEIKKELVCLQLTVSKAINIKKTDAAIIQLDSSHNDELFDLVDLVQPGYFRRKTMFMGDYFGIFHNNRLISVTGERMKMNKWTEVSAVVTHPDHSGKGYASQLIAHTVRKIFEENKIPFLHVAETNRNAISLYHRLGFVTRRKISFWNLHRVPT